MKFNISKIASLIKKSNHSKYEKLKIQLFFEWSLFRGFINLEKGYLELPHQEIENIIKNPYSYYFKGIIPLNYEVKDSSAISKTFKRLIKKFFRKFIIILRLINSYFIITNSFIKFFYKKIILKKNIKFIFESNKCRHLWNEYSNVIFFSLEDINNLINIKTNNLINWKIKIKSNNSYKFKIEDIASRGFQSSILNLLNSKKINFEIKTYKLNFPIYIINKIIIIKLLRFCIRKAKNIFFIDNSQGLLIQSKCLEEFINLEKSRIYNNQHGGGYFELDRGDFLLAELSPAYDKPLIGIYRSNLIRQNYPINGKNYSLRNKEIKNSVLIIEGADQIKKIFQQK